MHGCFGVEFDRFGHCELEVWLYVSLDMADNCFDISMCLCGGYNELIGRILEELVCQDESTYVCKSMNAHISYFKLELLRI